MKSRFGFSISVNFFIINARVNEGAIDTDKIGMNTPETLATLDTQDTGRI